MNQLGRRIATWVLALAGSVGGAGIVTEGLSRAPEMIIFAVALAVAAVPEGLTAVLTVALAFDRTPGVMQQPPRPPESPLLDRPSVRFVVGAGTMKALLALDILGVLPWMGYDLDTTRAKAFHFMAVG